MKIIKDKLIELLAFETLNYHNKNLLAGDDESRSRYLQKELSWLIDKVVILEKESNSKSKESIEMQNEKLEPSDFYRKTRQG